MKNHDAYCLDELAIRTIRHGMLRLGHPTLTAEGSFCLCCRMTTRQQNQNY